jgi:hypothetical protein
LGLVSLKFVAKTFPRFLEHIITGIERVKGYAERENNRNYNLYIKEKERFQREMIEFNKGNISKRPIDISDKYKKPPIDGAAYERDIDIYKNLGPKLNEFCKQYIDYLNDIVDYKNILYGLEYIKHYHHMWDENGKIFGDPMTPIDTFFTGIIKKFPKMEDFDEIVDRNNKNGWYDMQKITKEIIMKYQYKIEQKDHHYLYVANSVLGADAVLNSGAVLNGGGVLNGGNGDNIGSISSPPSSEKYLIDLLKEIIKTDKRDELKKLLIIIDSCKNFDEILKYISKQEIAENVVNILKDENVVNILKDENVISDQLKQIQTKLETKSTENTSQNFKLESILQCLPDNNKIELLRILYSSDKNDSLLTYLRYLLDKLNDVQIIALFKLLNSESKNENTSGLIFNLLAQLIINSKLNTHNLIKNAIKYGILLDLLKIDYPGFTDKTLPFLRKELPTAPTEIKEKLEGIIKKSIDSLPNITDRNLDDYNGEDVKKQIIRNIINLRSEKTQYRHQPQPAKPQHQPQQYQPRPQPQRQPQYQRPQNPRPLNKNAPSFVPRSGQNGGNEIYYQMIGGEVTLNDVEQYIYNFIELELQADPININEIVSMIITVNDMDTQVSLQKILNKFLENDKNYLGIITNALGHAYNFFIDISKMSENEKKNEMTSLGLENNFEDHTKKILDLIKYYEKIGNNINKGKSGTGIFNIPSIGDISSPPRNKFVKSEYKPSEYSPKKYTTGQNHTEGYLGIPDGAIKTNIGEFKIKEKDGTIGSIGIRTKQYDGMEDITGKDDRIPNVLIPVLGQHIETIKFSIMQHILRKINDDITKPPQWTTVTRFLKNKGIIDPLNTAMGYVIVAKIIDDIFNKTMEKLIDNSAVNYITNKIMELRNIKKSGVKPIEVYEWSKTDAQKFTEDVNINKQISDLFDNKKYRELDFIKKNDSNKFQVSDTFRLFNTTSSKQDLDMCYQINQNVIARLILAGSKINNVDLSGSTPLLKSVYLQNPELTQTLVTMGGDVIYRYNNIKKNIYNVCFELLISSITNSPFHNTEDINKKIRIEIESRMGNRDIPKRMEMIIPMTVYLFGVQITENTNRYPYMWNHAINMELFRIINKPIMMYPNNKYPLIDMSRSEIFDSQKGNDIKKDIRENLMNDLFKEQEILLRQENSLNNVRLSQPRNENLIKSLGNEINKTTEKIKDIENELNDFSNTYPSQKMSQMIINYRSNTTEIADHYNSIFDKIKKINVPVNKLYFGMWKKLINQSEGNFDNDWTQLVRHIYNYIVNKSIIEPEIMLEAYDPIVEFFDTVLSHYTRDFYELPLEKKENYVLEQILGIVIHVFRHTIGYQYTNELANAIHENMETSIDQVYLVMNGSKLFDYCFNVIPEMAIRIVNNIREDYTDIPATVNILLGEVIKNLEMSEIKVSNKTIEVIRDEINSKYKDYIEIYGKAMFECLAIQLKFFVDQQQLFETLKILATKAKKMNIRND